MKNGFRVGKTPSKAKVMDALETQLKDFQQQIDQLKMQNNQLTGVMRTLLDGMRKQITTVTEASQLNDKRSLVTLRLLKQKGVFTEEEHTKEADVLQVEMFDAQLERKVEEDNLMESDVVAAGDSVVVKIDAKDPETGEDLSQLSLLRALVTVGSGEFPAEFEDQLVGTTTGDQKTFTLVAPEEFGTYAGDTIEFTTTTFKVFTSGPSEDTEEGTSGDTVEETAADA